MKNETSTPRHIQPSNFDAMATYVMRGEDRFYAFQDSWKDMIRQIKAMTALGFTWIGTDGVDGFVASEWGGLMVPSIRLAIHAGRGPVFQAEIQAPRGIVESLTVGGDLWKSGALAELHPEILRRCQAMIDSLQASLDAAKAVAEGSISSVLDSLEGRR